MPRLANLHLLAIALAATTASCETTTASPAPSITTSPDTAVTSTSTNDIPLSLWSVAESLISSYYPSTTLSGVSTLTFPSTVVIDGSTFLVTHSPSPTTLDKSATSASATPTSTSHSTTSDNSSPSNHDVAGDQHLAIILGCVLGFLALALMAVIFLCMHRRKRRTGSFFMARSTSLRSTDTHSSSIRRWTGSSRRPDTFGTTAYVSAAPPNDRSGDDKQAAMQVVPQRDPPSMSQHPAYAPMTTPYQRQESNFSTNDNPFVTPMERMDESAQLGYAQQHTNHDESEGSSYRTAEGGERTPFEEAEEEEGNRPPTPFALMGFGHKSSPSQQQQQQQQQQAQRSSFPYRNASPRHQSNPFIHPDDNDEEEADVISPILPTRSPERRHSPMVHYPSVSEVSEFDFGEGRARPLRGHWSAESTDYPGAGVGSSSSDGEGVGWRAEHERSDGRYELP